MVVDDLSSGKLENIAPFDVELYQGSILSDLGDVWDGVDTVFHLAASVSVSRSVEEPCFDAENNILGSLRVLEACRKYDVRRVVFSSSAAIYGDPIRLPIDEGHPREPVSPYGLSKLAGESYARLYHQLYGLGAVSLRYFNVYGPRQDPESPYAGVISIFVHRLLEGLPLVVDGDGLQARDFVSVKDVVQANLLAASGGEEIPGRTFNVGTGTSTTIAQLAQTIVGEEGQISHGPPRPGDVRESVADLTLSRGTLGYQPRIPLEDGIRQFKEWYSSRT
jgi:UDP-glucose 4-epimerase